MPRLESASRAPAVLVVLFVAATCAALVGGAACGNPLAPQPREGLPAGSACTADLQCADGLACECGQCGAPTADADIPPLCGGIDFGCDEQNPSPCFASCTDTTQVGTAACVAQQETCAPVEGVLQRECECFGQPAPGEVCQGGEYVCAAGTAPNGQCYTTTCEVPPFPCVQECGGTSLSSNCVADEQQCDTPGTFPEADCGGCVAPRPSCLLDCDPAASFASQCDLTALQWSCSHISGSTLSTSCFPPDAGPDDGGLPDAGDADAGDVDAGDVDAGQADGGDDDGGPAPDGGAGDDAGADGGGDAGPSDGG